MNAKGWTYGSAKSTWSILIDVACLLVGGIPLLKVVGIPLLDILPPLLFIGTAVKLMLFIGGVFLLWDSFSVRSTLTYRVRTSGVVAGFLLALLGAVPLLLEFGVLNAFLPFLATLDLSLPVLEALLVFYGLYLLVDAFLMSPRMY